MTGYGDDWGSWKPHPMLANEWREFSDLSSQGTHNFQISKLCTGMKMFTSIDGVNKPANDKVETYINEHLSQSSPSASLPLTQFKDQGSLLLSQSGEDYDADTFFVELHEVLESHNIPLPDDLVCSLSELPQQAYPLLLKRLEEELTSEGLQTLCELAIESIEISLEQKTWLHPALICKFILLPKVMRKEECANEICQVLEEFARSCPKIVIVQILEPLFLNEESADVQCDLVKRVTSVLPVEHHLHIIKFVIEQCTAPLAIPKINVLIAVLRATTADLSAVLKKLTNLLENSAVSLIDNEPFSNLLLIIIRRLPISPPQPVKDLLTNIVRQNKSFNKQILQNVLKEKM